MFFDRFLNPVWHAAEALGDDDRMSLAIIITLYGGSRHAIEENLVAPVEKMLEHAPSSVQRKQLVDEALVALLRVSGPLSDESGKLGRCSTELVKQALGTLALADLSARRGLPALATLGESPYSLQSDEARTQLVVRWGQILKIGDLRALLDLTFRSGLPAAWEVMSSCLLGGLLLGTARVDNPTILRRARLDLKSFAPHQERFLLYLVEKLAAGVAVQDGRAGGAPARDLRGDSTRAKFDVSFGRDGRANVRLGKDAGFTDLMLSTALVMLRHLPSEDIEILEKWLGIRNRAWTRKEEDAFASAYLRLLWEGKDLPIELSATTKFLRRDYPTVSGTRLDVVVPRDVQRALRRMIVPGC